AKAFDGSCPLSPFIPSEQVEDPYELLFALEVNGVERQNGDPRLMLWDMFELAAHISWRFTLLPGDVVLTGTPSGVAPLKPDDRLRLMLRGAQPFEARAGTPWADPSAPSLREG
ncbi:MAG: fumarylacetoacetate hydrolase family protein, partial [Magnetococcales bacterium]|nr:fumarylacetoacetate hydrolase family protein [Magnetococcales bacterium]